MTDQVIELRIEVQQLLSQINNAIKENIYLIRELKELTAANGQFNSDLDKATEQFNTLMSKLKIQADEDTSESAITLSP